MTEAQKQRNKEGNFLSQFHHEKNSILLNDNLLLPAWTVVSSSSKGLLQPELSWDCRSLQQFPAVIQLPV